MALAPSGWMPATVQAGLLQIDQDEDASWVWNRDEATVVDFLLPAVTWAELAYQHED